MCGLPQLILITANINKKKESRFLPKTPITPMKMYKEKKKYYSAAIKANTAATSDVDS